MTTVTIKPLALITDKAVFEKACLSISKRGAKLDADIQHLALSAIAHTQAHGNPHYVNRLFLALSAGARKSALTAWFLAHGKVVANVEAGKKEMPFVYAKDKTTDMAGAAKNPWFTFKPDADPDTIFDIQAALVSIIKKAQGKNCDALSLAKVENLLNELKHDNPVDADDKVGA